MNSTRRSSNQRSVTLAPHKTVTDHTPFAGNPATHVGDENDILQCRVTAKLVEHLEIPRRDFGE